MPHSARALLTTVATSTPMITLPNLHTLVLHPGVLKPHYLQHTISAIHATVLGHFGLVFPDSKKSGQNIAERLFVDGSPLVSSFASSSSCAPYSSSSSSPEGDWPDIRYFAQYARAELVGLLDPPWGSLEGHHLLPFLHYLVLGRLDGGGVYELRADASLTIPSMVWIADQVVV